MPRSSKSTQVNKQTFAATVAKLVVRDTLRLSAKNAAHSCTAVLVPADTRDVRVYEVGAENYLLEFISSEFTDTKSYVAHIEYKDALSRLETYGGFDFLALVVESEVAREICTARISGISA
jgi:hypothetical protein